MEQVSGLSNVSSLSENLNVTLEKKLILAGGFNLFLNSKLDAKGRKLPKNPYLNNFFLKKTYFTIMQKIQIGTLT